MSSGSEWATEGWADKAEPGEKWEPKEAMGKIVRLRMKEVKVVKTPFADEAKMIVADVEQVTEDGYDSWSDSGIFGAWFIDVFGSRLPYSALGVVESVKTSKGFTMYQLRPLTADEQAKADKALDLPGF